MAKRKKRRGRKAALWLGIGTGVSLGTFLFTGVGWTLGVFMGLATATAGVAYHTYRGTTPTRVNGRTPNRRPPRASARPATGKTRVQRTKGTSKPTRVAPVGTIQCSAACRTSKKPKFNSEGKLTCDCACRGKSHGMYREGTKANIMNTPISPENRTTNRTAAAKRKAVSRENSALQKGIRPAPRRSN